MAKVRMQDIANQVGVSAVTVHNAIAGRKGVSEEVREKILNTAREMGYFQNGKKAGGKPGGLRNIGVVISEKYLADYITFYWKIYMEIAMEAPGRGCAVMAEVLKLQAEKERRLPCLVQENAVEGLIVMGEIDREYIGFLRSSAGMPVIFLDFYYKEIAGDAVVTDGFYGMYLMTEYLYERGFRRMAYVGSIHATSSIMDRYCGFRRSLLEHGVDFREDWLLEDRDEAGEISVKLPDDLPEAFVCNCDLTASRLIGELEKLGCRVPEDCSVVGFDNYLYPGLPDRGITTYEVDMKGMAETALGKILARLDDSDGVRKIDLVAGHIVEKSSVSADSTGGMRGKWGKKKAEQ